MAVLEVKDLCKTYVVNKRQNNVLKNVNFAVEDASDNVLIEYISFSGEKNDAISSRRA